MEKDILEFIEKFKFKFGKEIEEVFTTGNCYYFAAILKERFQCGDIYYLPISNHFLWGYKGLFYDIKGKYSSNEKPLIWAKYELIDASHKRRIIRDCILFQTR